MASTSAILTGTSSQTRLEEIAGTFGDLRTRGVLSATYFAGVAMEGVESAAKISSCVGGRAAGIGESLRRCIVNEAKSILGKGVAR